MAAPGARLAASKAKKPSGRPWREGQDGKTAGRGAPRQMVGPDQARLDAELFGRPGGLRHRQREHPRPRDRVFALGLVEREAHRLHTEGRGVLGEQCQDLPLVLRGLQRHGEGTDEVHLPGVVEAAARVLPVGAFTQGDAGQVKQVLGSLEGGRSQHVTDGSSQAGERRVPALGAVASGLDALKELHESRLEGAGRAVGHALRESDLETAAQVGHGERRQPRPRAVESPEHGGRRILGRRIHRILGRAAGHVRIPVEAAAGPPANEPRGHGHHVHGATTTDAVRRTSTARRPASASG